MDDGVCGSGKGNETITRDQERVMGGDNQPHSQEGVSLKEYFDVKLASVVKYFSVRNDQGERLCLP